MEHKYKIGATVGVFYPHTPIKESLALLRLAGVRHVEIGQNYASPETDTWQTITADDLKGFEVISLHAPGRQSYDDPKVVETIFTKVRHLQTLCDLSHVVFHPDVIPDFSIFADLEVGIAFENMDSQKSKFQTVAHMHEVFERVPQAKMVLDVNHVWTNDRSMALARQMYQDFADRIVEVHISGFSTLHDPLFMTQQVEIIRAVEDTSVPLIIESQMSSVEDLKREIAYIDEVLRSVVGMG